MIANVRGGMVGRPSHNGDGRETVPQREVRGEWLLF